MSPARGEAVADPLDALEAAAVLLDIRRSAWSLALFQLLELALVREVIVAAPAAGVEWTATVPAGSSWEVLLVKSVLATSAVAGARVPALVVKDGDGNAVARFNPGVTLAANGSSVVTYVAGAGATPVQSGFVAPLPTPPLIMPAAWSFTSLTVSLDVGDAYTAIILQVREWSPGRVARFLRYLTDDLAGAGGVL